MFFIEELLTKKGAWSTLWCVSLASQCDAVSFKHLSITDRLAATHKHRLTKKLVLRADLLALAYVSFQSRITLSLVPYLTWSDAQ